ncbi:MAG: UDP-3-O-acyl-N-acetylglucosamine deacetylase [Victivallaceae bacterium]|nr:UDP-3-O-acyl-N-acetylglucosamine deacetylase [Victivallaceae bacterium]
MPKQRTFAKSAALSGIALHTGARATLRLCPAEVNTGIVFRRADQPGRPEVKALATNVVDARRGTTIGTKETAVYTIEHIMSALHVSGIDNALIEMDGPEPPIGDGSALPFLETVLEAGSVEQDAEAAVWTAATPLYIAGGDTQLILVPADELKISCVTVYAGSPVETQYLQVAVTPETYRREICSARTFVDYRDLRQLMTMGLVKGGSLDSSAIIHDGAIICKDALRFKDEIVRHKILDLIGDIYLCGRRVKANIIAIKPGHYFNVQLAAAMLKQI